VIPLYVTAKNTGGFDHGKEMAFMNGKLAPLRFSGFDTGNGKG
jgi:hypothetical protein